MISFNMLSDTVRSLFALWTLLLCLVNIGSAVLAAARKRYLFALSALVMFAPCYFLWQVIFDISLFSGRDGISRPGLQAGGLPWACWLIFLVLLTAAAVFLFCFNIRYDKTIITPGAIKLYLDMIPCGICCWRESGRVLFSNICMNRLCAEITGAQLLNGTYFRDAVRDGILTADGKVWRFAVREIYMNNERLYEMIATDITSEYAKTEALKKDKAELSRLNRELSEYYLSIDESVRRQEILQAKMNIHDEMNRLMLSTAAADRNDTEALDKIFSLWEQNALLLCMDADKNVSRYRTDSVDSLAKAMGVSLVWSGELPRELSGKERELFFFTAQEAVVNAVKHARAKNMKITLTKTNGDLCFRFSNDGIIPEGGVSFEGGLANIAYLAEKSGATLGVETGEQFTLILCFNNKF